MLAEAKAKLQAIELARQCWDELADQGFPEEDIAPLVFRPWYEAVLKWATGGGGTNKDQCGSEARGVC